METKYHMSREWRFITIVENECQLEEMRLTRKVYSVCKTFNGEKLKYRCTAFRRTDCKYLMCSIRDDNGKYEIYEKGEHNHLLGLPSKARQSFGTHSSRAATALLKKSMKRSKLQNMKKMYASEDVPEQRFSAPIRFKRAKKNLSIGQLFHMGPGWTFFGTVNTPEDIEKIRHEHRVSILSKTFGGEKMKFRCSTYARSKCCYMLCVLHTNQGNYELYKYGQHTHPNRTPNSSFGSKNTSRGRTFAETQSPFTMASSSNWPGLNIPKFDMKKELAGPVGIDTQRTQSNNSQKKWKHLASFNTLEQLEALCKSRGLVEQQTDEIKTSSVIRTRYRCNTWQTTNCTYQMCSITDANSPLSTFELFEVIPNEHNHEQLDMNEGSLDQSSRNNSALYNRRVNAMDSVQDEKLTGRQLLKQYSDRQNTTSGPSHSDFLEELNNSKESNKAGLTTASSSFSTFQLADRKGELGLVAKKLSLDISSDGEMYMFFSKDPSMAGHWLELEEKPDVVLVSEFHQCKPVGEKCWRKADWDQFVCAVRGKCVEYFFGDTDSCGINQDEEF